MSIQVAAVDLGASSGRVMLAEVGRDVLRLEAVARFPNEPVRLPDGLHWNVLELYRCVQGGLREAARKAELASIGIDSWAVDYGLLRDGQLLGVPFHYRDERTAVGVGRVHQVTKHDELYARSGLQFLPFNTIYQLAADAMVEQADQLLMIPDLLGYWLSGGAVTERTNASTTGLLNVSTGQWDRVLLDRLGLPGRLFGELVDPGETVGLLRSELGLPRVPVTAVGSHDTASAVVGVPIETDDAAYISCGTWGLVGVELNRPVLTEESRLANFTNEGGVDDRTRFLTNVMGLWLLSECLRDWDRTDLPELLSAAATLPPAQVFDVQDPVFLPPGDMPGRIARWYADAGLQPPTSEPAIVRAIVDSLAQAFAEALDQAERLSGHTIGTVHLVGGGAQNALLCQATADRSGRVVLAGPVEATAIGNVLVQARAAGALSGGLEDLRRLIASTSRSLRFAPRAYTTG